MNNAKLASGDNIKVMQSIDSEKAESYEVVFEKTAVKNSNVATEENKEKQNNRNTITPSMIEENEIKLKERIKQCKNVIASLKLELNEEKTKLEKEAKEVQLHSKEYPCKIAVNDFNTAQQCSDLLCTTNNYSACLDSKLNCDENLMEYEKQLQRYQNTLNMAQIEKKNAIRKQMLAKAFKLKLMEVENQCNIELLRIKQSLQCLRPLHLIAEKWKTNTNDIAYDFNNFELIPRYPELSANSGSDITNISSIDDNKNAISNQTFEKLE